MAWIRYDYQPPVRASYLVAGATFFVFILYKILHGNGRKAPVNINTNQTPPYVGYPERLPWLFPNIRCAIRIFKNGPTHFQEGYQKYTRHGEIFTLKGLDDDVTILPADALNELKPYGDDVITTMADELLMTKYTLGPTIGSNPYHIKIVAKDLTSKLNQITPAIWDELSMATDDAFERMCSPRDSEGWQRVTIYKALLDIIARTSSRIFVGAPLCRELEYLHASVAAATAVFPLAILLRTFPDFTHFLIGPILSYPINRKFKVIYKHLKPVIEERLAKIKAGEPKSEEPNDLLQWVIRASMQQGPVESSSWYICLRMITLNFAAIHTTSLTATHVIYDLVHIASQAKPGEPSIIDTLREEVQNSLVDENGQVSFLEGKRPLQKLPKLDAFIKETARLHSAGTFSVMRKVADPQGFVFRGYRYPYGAKFALAAEEWHRDERNCTNANVHDYTRYDTDSHVERLKSKNTFEGSENGPEEKAGGEKRKKADRYLTTISEEFLVFGGLKHQCPGRFFSNNELRILISYFLLNYDIKPLGYRPKSIYVAFSKFCDPTVEIEIRRRSR